MMNIFKLTSQNLRVNNMCRLFGFRSIFSSQVHSSLVGANNAIVNQSEFHPDGWGVAYYLEGTPHIIKSPKSAITDSLFQKVSGIVSSKTVLAHIRNATEGSIDLLNCHPFQYGKWTFAHNGNVKNFSNIKEKFIEKIDRKYLRFLLGDTDSEVIFYYLLSFLKINEEQTTSKEIEIRFKRFLNEYISISGDLHLNPDGPSDENYLSFILTDGERMFCFNGGKTLHYSTHKKRCPDRESCDFFKESCENPVINSEQVQHFIIASEVLNAENIWQKTKTGDFLYLDKSMKLHTFSIIS